MPSRGVDDSSVEDRSPGRQQLPVGPDLDDVILVVRTRWSVETAYNCWPSGRTAARTRASLSSQVGSAGRAVQLPPRSPRLSQSRGYRWPVRWASRLAPFGVRQDGPFGC
jgi:hypothetical protein